MYKKKTFKEMSPREARKYIRAVARNIVLAIITFIVFFFL